MSLTGPLASALVVLGVSGCAAIFTGTAQSIQVSSQPPGARLFLNGAPVGTTPMTVTAPKGQTVALIGQYPGYPDVNVVLGKQFNPVAIINLFNVLGWVIDIATGAMWSYEPGVVYMQFQPAGNWNQSYPPPGGYPGATPPGYPPAQQPYPQQPYPQQPYPQQPYPQQPYPPQISPGQPTPPPSSSQPQAPSVQPYTLPQPPPAPPPPGGQPPR
jgi:hypothetical protein